MAFGTDSTRFYDPSTGSAVGEVVAASGKPRLATLKDAKKHGWRRSVTSVLREAAAPGLEQWRRKQLVMAALTLPKPDGMSLDDFIAKIEQDASEEGRKAAARGSELHGAIQKFCKGQTDPRYSVHLDNIQSALLPYGIDLTKGEPERSFCTPTYGGTCDWFDDNFVIDWKSKQTIEVDLKAWDMPHGVQLVAYDCGTGRPDDPSCRRLLNVFVGVEDGLVHVHEWTDDEKPRLKAMWDALLAYSLAKDRL